MSDRDEEMVAMLRRSLEAVNRGDFDAAIEDADPDVELIARGGFTHLRGVDALRNWMEPKTMEDVLIDMEQVEVAGNNVLAHHYVRGRGVTSGITLEMRFWTVWTVSEAGLVTRAVMFRPGEEEQAREAAGLPVRRRR